MFRLKNPEVSVKPPFQLLSHELTFVQKFMRPIAHNLLPETKLLLERLGNKIKNRRKQLRLTIVQLATKSLTSRSTITLIEKGSPGVSLGTYLQVMQVLGFIADLEIIVTEDMQDHIRLHRLLKGKV